MKPSKLEFDGNLWHRICLGKNMGNLKASKLESELFNSEIWPNAMGWKITSLMHIKGRMWIALGKDHI